MYPYVRLIAAEPPSVPGQIGRKTEGPASSLEPMGSVVNAHDAVEGPEQPGLDQERAAIPGVGPCGEVGVGWTTGGSSLSNSSMVSSMKL